MECPKCGDSCSWISIENGRVWCYHYSGYEKTSDGKIKKKVKKHYLLYVGNLTEEEKEKVKKSVEEMLRAKKYFWGKPGPFYIQALEDRIKDLEDRIKDAEDEKEKKELEIELKDAQGELRRLEEEKKKANIELRPIFDKERFIKYIEESLQLMQMQDDFNAEKVLQVLNLFKEFLLSNSKKDEKIAAIVRKFIEDLGKELPK